MLTLQSKEFYMKNFTRLFGVITLVAVILFSMAACNDGPSGPNTPNDPKIPYNPPEPRETIEATTNGRLTITGLDGYEGRDFLVGHYVRPNTYNNIYATFDIIAFDKAYNDYYPNSGKMNQSLRPTIRGIIKDGKVDLKVFKLDGPYSPFSNYEGTETVTLDVYIYSITIEPIHVEFRGTVTVNFVKGIGEGKFVLK
jgi:hypothetical protein